MSANLPDVDLMVRTSGEQRLSNFMLWQLAYAEFIFTPVCWPDFIKNTPKNDCWNYNCNQAQCGNNSFFHYFKPPYLRSLFWFI